MARIHDNGKVKKATNRKNEYVSFNCGIRLIQNLTVVTREENEI